MHEHRRHVRQHISKYKFVFGAVILSGLINNVVSFLLPVSIGEFFALFFHSGSSKANLLHWIGIELYSVQQFFIFFFFLLAIKAILSFVENYMSTRQGELFVRGLRESVFDAQIHWSASSWLRRSYGKYLLRYSNDMKSIQLYLTKGFLEGINSTLFLLVGFLIMAKINWSVTLVLFLLLVTGLGLIYLVARWQSGFIIASRTARSSLLAYVARQFSRFHKLKDRHEEAITVSGFREKSAALYERNMKYNITESLMLMLVPVYIFGIIGVLLWSMILFEGKITAPEGLMMVLILIMMEGGIRKLLKVPSYINKGKISIQKVDKLYVEPEMRERQDQVGVN
ncbi:MAG: ABC transporter transmembrane domain-containing protein [Bacteroidota bacterium]|nr:ABC transporter transmembrane domain-containing protein [Bacteroidota bacterium]